MSAMLAIHVVPVLAVALTVKAQPGVVLMVLRAFEVTALSDDVVADAKNHYLLRPGLSQEQFGGT